MMVKRCIKILMIFVSCIIVACILAVAMLNACNETILRSDSSFLKGLVLLMSIEPKDYWVPVLLEDFDISNENQITNYHFHNKYKGLNLIILRLENYSSDVDHDIWAKKYIPELKMRLSFKINGEEYLSKDIENISSTLWSFQEKESGLTIAHYKCPDDLPIDSVITCEVKIIVPDPELASKCGPVKFVIQKISDL